MASTLKKLGQQTLTGSGTQDTLYTVPGSTQAIVKHISVVNYSASACTIKMWHDGTANSNLILPPVSIDAGGFAEFEGEIVMEAADTLKAEGGAASSITITLHGVEIT